MAIRRRRKRNTVHIAPARFFAVTAAVLVFPVLLRFFMAHGDVLGRFGQSAAILSAAVNMPDSGLILLEERFRDELYNVREEENIYPEPPYPAEEAPTSPDEMQEGEAPARGEESGADEPAQPDQAPSATKPPAIPEAYTAAIIAENFSGRGNEALIPFGSGLIRNETKHENEDVEELLETPMSLELYDSPEPQVLIMHTHATESFERFDRSIYDTRNTWRSTDNNNNMVAVGNAMQEVLEANGIGVIHDTTQHDHPSYNGSYERSAVTVEEYLEQYPSISIVLDLHRDAMQRGNNIVKAVAEVDGRKAAQIMIISGCDDGTMNMPDWEENLRFAAQFQHYMERSYPELTRPVYFCYRKYNQDLTTGSLLLEIGSNANTLEEAIYSAQLAGEALSQLIRDHWMAY